MNDVAATYDAAAKVSTSEGGELRRAHNKIKRDLILEHCSGLRVLDLGCGRGGDVHKWAQARARVLGLDASPASVAEARARAAAAGSGARFRVCRDVGRRDDLVFGLFDAVTCMFALHYFFADPATADSALRFVRRTLRLGGVFVGVAPDGDRTREILQNGNFDGPDCSLRAAGPAAYTAKISGVLAASEVVEPYLTRAGLEAACERCNLDVVHFERHPPASPGVFVMSFVCVAV